jgi:hypothetical protein
MGTALAPTRSRMPVPISKTCELCSGSNQSGARMSASKPGAVVAGMLFESFVLVQAFSTV